MKVNQVNRDLRNFYLKHRPSNLTDEISLCDELSRAIGGKTEVITPVGRIDLLNDYLILETKISRYWKQAIGQLFCYELYYKRPNKGIGIIGVLPRYTLQVCEELNLWLFHYSYNDSQWNLLNPRN